MIVEVTYKDAYNDESLCTQVFEDVRETFFVNRGVYTLKQENGTVHIPLDSILYAEESD